MTLTSMTGFASQEVLHAGHAWHWEMRAVNGRTLDLKLRLPDGIDGLEAMVRPMVSAALRRGSVQISLRRKVTENASFLPDAEQLERVFAQIAAIESAALRSGVTLAPVSAAEILTGGLLPKAEAAQDPDLLTALRGGLLAGLASLNAMREAEGRALTRTLTLSIGRIGELVEEARALEVKRGKARKESLRSAIARVLEKSAEFDPGRLEQELALIAVKADVTEELDRLAAHVEAARALIAEKGAVGRKLDFLTQEFNREANTLCSKAQFPDLTRLGLDLKAVIDQVREQVQNVE